VEQFDLLNLLIRILLSHGLMPPRFSHLFIVCICSHLYEQKAKAIRRPVTSAASGRLMECVLIVCLLVQLGL
jgi:hypothetical protein